MGEIALARRQWDEAERAHVERMTRVSAVGSPVSVRDRLAAVRAY